MFFSIINSFAYTPLQALYPVECLATENRAKGMSMYGVVVNVFSFINLYAGPIALQNIAYKYVFVSLSSLHKVCIIGSDSLDTDLRWMGRYRVRYLVLPLRRDCWPYSRRA